MDSPFVNLSDLEEHLGFDSSDALTSIQQPKAVCWMALFLRLPGEVRNQIYEHVAEDEVLSLEPNNGSFFASPPSHSWMYSPDQQIFNEYTSIAYLNAPTIQATVYDFDFSHVAAFLDTTSEDNISSFPCLGNKPKRRFIINMEITDHCSVSTIPPNFSRWLDRIAQASKGAGIKLEYEISKFFTRRSTDMTFFRYKLLRHIVCELREAGCNVSGVEGDEALRAKHRKMLALVTSEINRTTPTTRRTVGREDF